jgi:hypothetical protein
MSIQGKLDAHERTISVYVAAARQMIFEEKPGAAEALCQRALAIAERIFGEASPLSGKVLVELFYLYQDAGRETEAALAWQRVRRIIIANHPTKTAQNLCPID